MSTQTARVPAVAVVDIQRDETLDPRRNWCADAWVRDAVATADDPFTLHTAGAYGSERAAFEALQRLAKRKQWRLTM